MKGKATCENCKKEFEWERFRNQTIARFCCKKCWYENNAKKLASFNDNRFQWNLATQEEKLQRLKHNYEQKVIKQENCWDWKGVFDKNGYGLIPGGYHKQEKAHRVSWMIHKGKIPKGYLICHHCDNPKCSNPEHLFLGTIKDNANDREIKLRGVNGEKIKNSKLTDKQVIKIKELLFIGVTSCRIAKDFCVSDSRISAIKHGKAWKHVKEPTNV